MTDNNSCCAPPKYRVAVTGATGLVGSNLIAELIKAGYGDIVAVVRNAGKIPGLERTLRFHGLNLEGSPVKVAEADFSDTGALGRVFRGAHTVFDCAGAIMTGKLSPQQLINNNVCIARSVVDASLEAGVRKIIHTSSITVLGRDAYHSGTLTEECRKDITPSHSAYAQSKHMGDIEMMRGGHAGLEVVIVYPSTVIGEGDWSLNGSSAMMPIIARGIPFYAKGMMGYVDVRDVGKAMAALDGHVDAAGKTFIISAGNLSFRELITIGAKAAGKRPPSIKVGKGTALAALWAIRALTTLRLVRDFGIRRSNLDDILYGTLYDGSKIEKFCNFAYSPLDGTIRRVMGIYLEEQKTSGKSRRKR